MSPALRTWIVRIVTAVWLMNFVASAIPPLHYTTDPTIHAVFMAVVGGAIALGSKDKNGGSKKDEGDDL